MFLRWHILSGVQYEAILGPEEVLSERPFTDAENTTREVDVMRYMLEEEREQSEAPDPHVTPESRTR